MLVRAGMALAVVTSGVALGAMLGAAANPEMKKPPEKPWQGALQAPVAADPGYRIMVEAAPQDLSPYRDSYAPSWAHEEVTDWEPDYPAWSYSDVPDERFADTSLTDEPRIDQQPVQASPEVTVSPEASPQPIVPIDLATRPQPLDSVY
jgi:hypothetical protein